MKLRPFHKPRNTGSQGPNRSPVRPPFRPGGRQGLGVLGLIAIVAAVVFVADALARRDGERDGEGDGRARTEHVAGQFDYYVLVLSWSPTYCETEGRDRNEPQCDGPRPYAFVVHGLWPQYQRGWPDFCRVSEDFVPNPVISATLDIMPSRGLVVHQYRKHGTCSGLKPAPYFAEVRQAFEAITIPEPFRLPADPITISPSGLEQAFLAANPAMRSDQIAVSCRGNRLHEVRICLNKDLSLRACGPNEAQKRLCDRGQIVLPPVRRGRG